MPLPSYDPLSPSSPDALVQVSRESEQNLLVSCLCRLLLVFSDNCPIQHSGSGLFANNNNILISGGTFVVSLSCWLYKRLIIAYLICQNNVNIPSPTTRERQIPVLQKPNSSSLFVGQKDVLNKLQRIFIHCAESRLMSRRSCLLWGTGGIGKTQICLKFIEEISNRLPHVFWVDASSKESIVTSLRGISSIFAAQASCMDSVAGAHVSWSRLG